MNGMESTGAWSIPAEHLPGLYALLLSPIAIWLLLGGIRLLARRGNRFSEQFLTRYQPAPRPLWAACWLMLTTGFIHLALVPTHWSDERGTALLFVLDGLSFFVVSVGVFWGGWWRSAAVLLCLATILAYLFYIVTGREDVDALGLATKLIELAAFGLLLVPRRLPRDGRSRHGSIFHRTGSPYGGLSKVEIDRIASKGMK